VRLNRPQLLTFYALILLGLNIYVAHRIFAIEYSAHLESNEGTFMAIARGMAEHPLDLMWWPFWNAGIPFENTYLPLLHAIVAVFSRLTGCSIPLSFHAVSGMFYCLQPVALFLFAAIVSRRIAYSFIGSLLYSLTSPAAIIFSSVRWDVGGAWNARRLQILGFYGEGPHMTTVALVPLAALFLHLALKHRKLRYYLLTGAAMAGVVLSNAFGTVDLLILTICLLATVHSDYFFRKLLTTAAIGATTYLIISPTLTPSFLRTIQVSSRTVGGDFSFTARSAIGFLLVAAGFAFLWWITRRMRAPDYLRLFLLFAFVMSAIPMLGVWRQVFLFPQPTRYEVEMEMALLMAVALAAPLVFDRAPRVLRMSLLACLLILAARQTVHYVRYARRLILPIDITTTVPYKMAMFLKSRFHTERVFVAGGASYLMNYFTDLPQLHGGHDPHDPNWVHKAAIFTIYSGMNAGSKDAEISVLWLRAFGVQAITVPGPTSVEYFKVFANSHKFDGVLPVLWNYEDTKVYAIPNRSSSLAHVVPANEIVRHVPVHGLDVGEVSTYVAALENPSLPPANMEWHNLHSFVVQTTIRPGQALSIQETYAHGWHAWVNGKPQPVSPDALGLMVVTPDCNGDCRVEMNYDGGAERKACLMAMVLALIFVATYASVKVRRKIRMASGRPQ
jgi:hypothetical protein